MMTKEGLFDCFIIGEGKLVIECAKRLLENGHIIHGIISNDIEVRSWSSEKKINAIVLDSDNRNTESFLNTHSFDYLFSIVNRHSLTEAILCLPKCATINYFEAPLPRHSGIHSAALAIQKQETQFGITWHEAHEEMDAGDILKQVTFPIEGDDTTFSLELKCYQAAIDSFAALVDELSSSAVTHTKQDTSKRFSAPISLLPESMAIIDWSNNANKVDALVRGLSYQTDNNLLALPKTLLNNTVYLITEVQLSSEKSEQKPGTIVKKDNGNLVIATGDNNIVITTLLDISGQKVEANNNALLSVRACFSALSAQDSDTINTLSASLSENEAFWTDALLNAEPFTFEAHGAQPLSSEGKNAQVDTATLPASLQDQLGTAFPTLPLSTAIANLYCCFLRRMADLKSFDIGLSVNTTNANNQTIKKLIAQRVPLNLNIDSQQSIRTLMLSLTHSLDSITDKGSYALDLIPRTQNLTVPDFPVAIEQLNSLEEGSNGYSDTLLLSIQKDSANYQWKYNPASLSPENAKQIIEKFAFFLQNALANLDTPLAKIYLISEDEMQTILFGWNQTEKSIEHDRCIHQLFETQVSRRPETAALVYRDQEISYGELNAQANKLANKLITLGTQPDSLVGIFIERSIEMMIGLLAIQKAGAAYVPLDPAYPRDRIALMITDSEASILLTHSKLKHELPANTANIVCIDQEVHHTETSFQSASENNAQNINTPVSPDNLAYVIYTSGSTGTPKGVMVEHRNAINFMEGMDDTLGFHAHSSSEKDPGVWLAVTSISFDISVLELFWTLTRGFKVVIQEEEARTISAGQQSTSKVDRKMDVGLFYFSSDAGPNASGNRYKILMEGAKFADTHDFSTVWTPERHFHLFGGLYPNPSVTSAAVAAITNNISIRAGSIVLPLHNTIRVAEEWSVVDNLSNGRVGFSFASGWHTNDFALKPENFENRRQIMFDEIETVRKLWRGESIEVLNGDGQPFEARIYPPSIQKEPPIWITTAGNIDTFRSAGEGGFNVLTNLLGQSIEDLTNKIAAYREGRKAKGHQGDGNVSVMVHTFVGKDVDEVREIVRKPFSNYLKTSFDLVKIAPWAFPAFKQPSKTAASDASFDADSLTSEDMDALIDHAFERYFETAGIFGTPSSVLPLIDQLKTAGIDEVACLIDFGVDNDIVLDNLQHLNTMRQLANPTNDTANQEYSVATQLRKHGVTHFQCTPSMARILASDSDTLAAMNSLEKILLGGEALPADLASKLKKSLKGDLINVYGPTETTIWSTSGVVPDDTSKLTIGRPIANTKIYILDSSMQPTPVGVPGELMIGGKGVVRGYHKRPELTAEKFIANPLAIQDDPMIYRTGDLAKYSTSGEIEYLGRLDHQVKLRGYRIELGEIESLINANPSVKETVVIAPETEQGTQDLLAYVVPATHSANQSTSHWQTIWDEAYRGNTAIDDETEQKAIDPIFNISGWLDSYTGEQHAHDHMREWVDAVVQRVLDLKPKRVLEIGCGTGLILYGVAPHCDSYVGVDFSESALALIDEQVKKMGMTQVSLVQSAADALSLENLDTENQTPFDLVIINSVVQYFPTASYLTNVLKNMTSMLKSDGQIFIGDVRSLPLKNTFHTALEVSKAPTSLTIPELNERIKEHHEHESELLVDPDYFLNLPQEIPTIGHVDTQLKRGYFRNEMSTYRFDIVLQLGKKVTPVFDDNFEEVPEISTLSGIQEYLNNTTSKQFVIRDIPNARLAQDVITQELLSTDESKTNHTFQLVSDLRNAVNEHLKQDDQGVQPEDVYQLNTQLRVALTWATPSDKAGHKNSFDAYFYPAEDHVRLQLKTHSESKPSNELCFEPTQQTSAYELADRLKDRLRDKLPEFMVPSEFIILDSMPLTPNGKINRKALPKPEKRQRVVEEEFVAPESDIEQTIATVFQEMLNLEKIGTKDNFFSLGANSLLIAQANNRLSQRLERNVSLVAMYRFPTIEKLSEHLSGKSDNQQSAKAGADRAEKRKAAAAARRSQRRARR